MYGNTSTAYFDSVVIQGAGLTVNGNFTLTGTTVYSSNTFLLSANVATAVSSYYNVDRGSTGVDAAFRWNELSKYWDMLNVTSNTYYRVLTNEYFNDTLTSTSTTSVATANTANALNNLLNTANSFLQTGIASSGLYANGAFLRANSAYGSQNTTGIYANSAFLQANSAYASQNVTGTYANSAYGQANTATTNAATADSKAVTAGSYANSAYGQANTATNNAAGASLYANGAFVQANAAFLRANTPTHVANSAALYANGAFVQANAAYAQANTTASSATNASNLSSGTVPVARLSGITTTQLSASAGITNAQLANNTISGVSLGSSLLLHSAGTYLVGNTYNGSTAQTWSVNATTTNTSNTIAARDNSGDIYATVFRGLATSANYADLAEKYLADKEYEVGTVVSVGGEAEVTASSYGERAIGVVSAQPAYMMNSELEGGTYIALKGRVPVKVTGTVRKGQRLVAHNKGTAVAAVPHANDVFGIALESSDDTGTKLIEAVIL